jgi:hypothetical protein
VGTRIKQYHKEGRALRTETTINDPRDVGKRLTNTRTYARVLRPGLAHVLSRAPTPTSELRQTFDALEAAMDRWRADTKLTA